MSNDHQHSPQHEEVLKKQSLEQHEVKEVLNVFKKYAVPALIVVVIVCGAFLLDRYLKTSKASKEHKADSALVTAMSPADFEEIIEKYGSTSSAPIALMQLAMSKFSDGDYDAAQDLYDQFLKKYGKHEMAAQAELNRISCQEAKGEYGEAHLKYGEFANSHKNSYLAPVAMMGQARCLEALGSAVDAKRAYEDLIVAYPGSSWANLAQTRMTVLNSSIK